VITAIVNNGEIDAPNRAERLLRETEEKFTHASIAPNRVTFNVLIDAWAKSGQPERAQAILLRMEELAKTGVTDMEPDFVSFSSVIVSSSSIILFILFSLHLENLMPNSSLLARICQKWSGRTGRSYL